MLSMGIFCQGIRLEPTEDIIWTETGIKVDEGVKKGWIDFKLESPCDIYTGEDNSIYNMKNSAYKLIKTKCNETFDKMVREVFQDLESCLPSKLARLIRPKRFLEPVSWSLIGGLTAAAVGGGGSSIYSYISTDSSYNRLNDMENENKRRDDELRRHSASFDDAVTALKDAKEVRSASIELVQEHNRRLMEQKNAILQLSEINPHVFWDAAFLTNLIAKDGEFLERVVSSCGKNRLNTQALFKLTNIKLLKQTDEADTYLEELVKIDSTTLSFRFNVKVTSTTTHVYKANALRHWINITEQPVFVEYYGTQFVLYNQSNGCLKGIETPTDRWVVDTCENGGFVDPRLNDWREVVTNEDELKNLTKPFVYKSDTSSFVYCFYHEILVNGSKRLCPPFIFSIPLGVPFQLPGLNHTVSEFTYYIRERTVNIDTFLTTNKTDEDYDREVKLLQQIREKNDKNLQHLKFRVSNDTLVIPLNLNYIVIAFIIIAFLSFGGYMMCRRSDNTNADEIRRPIKEDTISIYNNISAPAPETQMKIKQEPIQSAVNDDETFVKYPKLEEEWTHPSSSNIRQRFESWPKEVKEEPKYDF